MKTKEQLEAVLSNLEAELKELRAFLDSVDGKRERLRQITGGFGSHGEWETATLELRDVQFPIYRLSSSSWEGHERIISVSEKWITLRHDGREATMDYSTTTGFKKHSKSSHRKINHEKALKIWSEHTNKP